MGERYSHEHHESSETIIENVVNTIVGSSSAGHNSHSHTVTDNQTGESGHGHGTNASEAKDSAWSDLKQ